MRRYVPLLIAGAALIAAACSDSTAPTQSTADANLPTVSALGYSHVQSARANDYAEGRARTYTFQIRPTAGSARFGSFVLTYSANAVCDPRRSSYGPSEWGNDCPTLSHPFTVRVQLWVEDGRLHADFEPDIRFNPNATVTLSSYVPAIIGSQLSQDELQAQYGVLYSTRHGNDRYLIDDASQDASLRTTFNTLTGKVTRRVLHFSGYYVRSGKYCEEGNLDPECILEDITW